MPIDKPTDKQRKAFQLKMQGMSMRKALVGAGYAHTVANTPALVENSKGWKMLMAEYLPDEVLLKVHQEGLQAGRITEKKVGEDADGNDIIVTKETPDHATRHKFLQTAYEIKGKYEGLTGLPGGISITWTNAATPIADTGIQDPADSDPLFAPQVDETLPRGSGEMEGSGTPSESGEDRSQPESSPEGRDAYPE